MLLYAALEIRLGIEARLHEYLDAAQKSAILKKRGWQVSKLAKDLDRRYKAKTKIVSFMILGIDGTSNRTFLFTPVTDRAKKIAEQLGNYLHYSERVNQAEGAWRNRLELLVTEGIGELTISTTGTLLAPPMWNRQTGVVRVVHDTFGVDTVDSLTQKVGKKGELLQVQIEYHDSIPT